MPKLVIRADASAEMGGGHVMRCLNLARPFQAVGWEIHFCASPESARFAPSLAASGYEIIPVDGQGLAEILALQPNVVVFDGYHLTAATEQALVDQGAIVMALDDLVRPHAAHIVLDPSLGREASAYEPICQNARHFLMGPNVLPLHPDYARMRDEVLAARDGREEAVRLLVSMGLTDVGGISASMVRAGLAAGFAEIDVVIGPHAPSREILHDLARKTGRVLVHESPKSLIDLIADADVAVGAAGGSAWERCVLGLPTVIIVLADNQRQSAQALAARQGALVVDVADEASRQQAAMAALSSLRDDDALRRASSQTCRTLCDGGGAARVFAVVLGMESDGP